MRRPRGMGQVKVRTLSDGTKSYQLRVVRDGQLFAKTVAAGSMKQAQEQLPDFIADIKSGRLAKARSDAAHQRAEPTLAEWSETFLSLHVTQDEDRVNTKNTYRAVLRRRVLPTLGHKQLSAVSSPMVRELFKSFAAEGLALKTMRLIHSVVRRLFDTAKGDGATACANPVPKFADLRLGRADKKSKNAKRHSLSAEQVAALLAACAEHPDLSLYVAIGAARGLRPGEIVGLTWADIDFKEGKLTVEGNAKRATVNGEARVWRGKTKTESSERTVAIGPALLARLADAKARQEEVQHALRGHDGKVRSLRSLVPADACIFPADPTNLGLKDAKGQPIPRNPRSFEEPFKRACARAGLPANVSPHWLRHSHASHSIRGGADLANVSAGLGHADVQETSRTYVHAISEAERSAAAHGDALLTGTVAEPTQNAADSEAGHKGRDKGQ